MDDIAELAAAIDREKLERAKRMTPQERFLAGAELFEDACEVSRAGIRALNPGFTDTEVEEELRRRLGIADRLDEKREP
jgi:hypothetical protein